ncbi:N-6 DNA methylase [uncultured Brachyspira sp.]|uniref:HsdM family class I SAM-dependent methyltransferase n=1 Tax=uncultured Brachyspira sp. TaxID=221953 RepID=UPI002596E5C5|nr:N-6 DNA methylase [uncultured Brachyspira sp.]
MSNERITEDIVREHFKKDKLFNSIIIDEQKTKNPKIQKLLKNASKSGSGVGKPEFIIHGFKFPFNNLVIVIECKADIKKHKSTSGDRHSEYAVDGVKLYASYLSKEFDVLAIAVSGQVKDDIKVSYFYYKQGSNEEINLDLENDKLYILEDCLEIIKSKNKKEFDLEQLRDFAKKLNDDLHNHSIPEDKRAFLLSGILLALNRDTAFRSSYKLYDKPDSLANALVNSITDILDKENIASIKKETLTLEYSFIKTHHSLIEENDEYYNDMYIKRIIEQIEENVAKPLEESKNQKYIDAIGEMYTEFLRYANNEAKLGIVLTPPHITEFMCDLIDINKDDVVIDICCGTAGFLIAAMTKMIKDCKNDSEKIDYIKKNQIIGIEEKSNIHALGCSNMILHGDGKSHIIQLDCFKADKSYFCSKKITKALLNPPYKAKESPAKQLEFVEKSLELLEPNGKCAAIVQMSCAIKNDNKVKQIKSKILSKHTLDAVISMPDDLFYPVGVVTCIMIFTAHRKHSKDYNTWFGYLKDDGFEKRKHKGRVDLKNKWNDIKNYFINLLKNKQEKVGISIQHHVEYCDEWCAEAYMETDYNTLTKEDFENTIKKYLSFSIMNGSINGKN